MNNKQTALVLGGGGARGAYETGVWQALRELGIKLDLVCGTSVGSITAAAIAQNDFETAVKIWQELETSMVFDIELPKPDDDKPSKSKLPKKKLDIAGMPIEEARAYIKEIFSHGGASTEGLRKILNHYIDENRIRNSGMDYGLMTVELTTLTPQYMFLDDIPKGLLIDYIIASCSIAPALKPHEINGKQYIDGGYYDVMPVRMALEKGATDIITVDLKSTGIFRTEDFAKAQESANSFFPISCQWDLGSVLSFNKDNARRLIRLGYLDTMKTYGVLNGYYYTFPNREFGKKSLKAADCAAKVFELDPSIIYTQNTLNEVLKLKITEVASIKEGLKNELSNVKLTAIKTFIRDIVSRKNGSELITLILADDLKKEKQNPILASRAASRIIETELSAAKYLVSYNLV